MAHSTTNTTAQAPDKAGFALDLAAAEAQALSSGERVADILDRMDAADPFTLTATNPILSARTDALSLGRVRSHLVIDQHGVLLHDSEVPADSITGPEPLIA